MTLSLRLFGGFELSDARARRDWIPVQPKPAAILSYLALAVPRFQRRDALLALFWPELDAEHARGALSKAVHHLRRSLGEGALEGRGDEELGLAHGAIRVDAVAFQENLASGRREEALMEYTGELLAGFHCAGAPDFERWLDRERSRLSGAACAAAQTLAASANDDGDLTRALHWSRRATELGIYDEAAARLLIRLLARAGDHAGATRAYREFERRLAEELEVEPSRETQELVEWVRQSGRATLESTDKRAAGRPGVAAAAHESAVLPARPGSPDEHVGPREGPTIPNPTPARDRGFRATTVVWVAAVAMSGLLVARWSVANPGGTELGTGDRGDPAVTPPPYSIAVLPFAERAAPDDGGYLAYGVTEELTNTLAREPGLLVSAAPAASALSRTPTAPAAVGRLLRVSNLVTGTIERRRGGIRIVVHLTNASSGEALWRRTYDITDGDLSTVYASATREIRAALAPESNGGQVEAGPPAARTANPRAYQSYLLGLYELQKRSSDGARAAVEHFARATREDSSYADAFAALAMGYARRIIYRDGSTRAERIAGVTQAASRALRLDSASVAAWTALALSRFLDGWDWQGSDSAFRRAIATNPNHATAYNFYSQLLVATGRLREGEAALDRMRQLDPVTSGSSATFGLVLYHLRRFDQSAQVLRGVVQGDSSYENGLAFLTRPLLMLGLESELASVLRYQLVTQRWSAPEDAEIVARAAADPARGIIEARRVLDRWERAEPSPLGPVQQARIRARLGDHDRAIQLLQRAYDDRNPALYAIGADPAFDRLRDEPRFRSILIAMRLPLSR